MAKRVFISYHRPDQEDVVRLVRDLEEPLRGSDFEAWLDQKEVRAGQEWMPVVFRALQESDAVVVCIGPNGAGEWQIPEAQIAELEHRKRKIPVIPLLLPGASRDNEIFADFPFLELKDWIDYRDGLPADRASESFSKLVYSITGVRPSLPDPNPSPTATATVRAKVSRTVERLGSSAKKGSITFFVGTGISPTPVGDGALGAVDSRLFRLLPRKLCESLQLVTPGAEGVLPSLDTTFEFFIAKQTLDDLVDIVQKQIPNDLNGISREYEQLAILAALLGRGKEARGTARQPRLIVSTNIDWLLECALLLARVRFTRIVQYWEGEYVQIERFVPRMGELPRELPPGEVRSQLEREIATARARGGVDASGWLDEQRSGPARQIALRSLAGENGLSLDQLGIGPEVYEEVLLYKLYGSLDVPESCALSAGQHLHLLAEAREHQFIPSQICAAIVKTDAAFLGYWPLDPDLRLLYSMFREQLDTKFTERVVVPFWPPGPEESIREAVHERTPPPAGLEVLDETSAGLLEYLIQRVVSAT